jgi:AraC-like DNA-binding protein
MKALVLLLILLSFCPVAAQTPEFKQQKDSLLKVIADTRGDAKLDAWKKLCQLPIPPDKADEYFQFSEEFIKEAQMQKNIAVEGMARIDELTKLHNYNRKEELLAKADSYLDFFTKHAQWDNYYLTYFSLIETYIHESKYEKAMSEAERIYEQAKKQRYIPGIETATYLLGVVNINNEQLDEAEKFLRETISLSDNPSNFEGNFSNARRRAYEELCRLLLKKKEYAKAIEMAEELMGFYDAYIKANPAAVRNKLYAMLIYYRINAEAYLGLDELDRSEKYCAMSEELMPNDPRAMSYIYFLRAQISEKRKQYEKSIGEFDSAFYFYALYDIQPDMVLLNKARVLCKMGRGNEAFPIYEAVAESEVVKSRSLMNSRIGELRTQYEVDKHIAEKQRNRNYFLFALAGCALLAIALGIWMYYSRRIVQKNRTMAQQIKELNMQYNLRDEEILRKTTFDTGEAEEDDFFPERRHDKLCISIRDLMLKDRIYRNPAITREQIIEQLGTNRQLFDEAVQFCFGMSFSDYINALRLKDAALLLEQSDLPVEIVAEKAGYGSLRTLQRQFYRQYNMTPKDYRMFVDVK